MVKNVLSTYKSWHPDRSTSKGATAYHDAVVDASWHKENIEGLLKIINREIKNGDVIIDFGAGTGASAVYLLMRIKKKYKLWLVDNSPSWLGKAYEILASYPNIVYIILEKIDSRYATLTEVIGKEIANHVISANTVHLIPNIKDTFKGVYDALKPGGTFTFQSGNIVRRGREKELLMIDDTVKKVHDIAIKIIRKNAKYTKYKKDLEKKISTTASQRKIIFPDPRPITYYREILESTGFKNVHVSFLTIKVIYNDWLNFLRVRRLQAGILPEIGGKDASLEEEKDRDDLITLAANELFTQLKNKNQYANNKGFSAEWTYVKAEK